MITIKSEQTSFWDIDGTLILAPEDGDMSPVISIPDPLSGPAIRQRVNHSMVRLLKEEAHRGAYVVVWSRGGWEWARSVIKALELEAYVHLVMSKPMAYFDDVPIEEWLPYRVFLKPDMKYRR